MLYKLSISLSTLLAVTALGAIRLPEASPGQSVSQEVGISRVTVVYHRPAVRNRKIWGDLVPNNAVWRLGANEATTIELSHEARVAGHKVPAGKYSLFAIPNASAATVILNKNSDQWGAFSYKQEEDLLRFPVKAAPIPSREWMEIDLSPADERTIRVNIDWEKMRLAFNIEFDTPTLVWQHIEAEIAAAKPEEWQTFHQAARYALRTGQRLEDAQRWTEKAMVQESYWNYELKGLLLHRLGRDNEALPLMLKAKELAKGKAPQEWIDGIDREIASWKKPAK